MILYLAAPLFTAAEIRFNADLAAALRVFGYNVRVPQEFCNGLLQDQLALKCMTEIDDCDWVIVNCDGTDVDSGTSFEAGYAYARGIKTLAFRTDFRRAGDCLLPANLMIAQTARDFIIATTTTPIDLAHRINEVLTT